jgi:hypothetical protein
MAHSSRIIISAVRGGALDSMLVAYLPMFVQLVHRLVVGSTQVQVMTLCPAINYLLFQVSELGVTHPMW